MAVPIRGLVISEPTGRGIRLDEQSMFISNESSHIRDALQNPHLLEHMGKADIGLFLAPKSPYIYATRDIDLPVDYDQTLNGHLTQFLFQVLTYLGQLWLVREHCAFPDAAFIMANCGTNLVFSKNYMGDHVSLANGISDQLIKFTMAELRNVRLLCAPHLKQILGSRPAVFAGDIHKTLPQKRGTSRINRALHQIHVARSTRMLPAKIAHYVEAFEALFSTSTTELNYRLSERASFFLGNTATDRRQIFDNMKLAYSVRSSVAHGAELDKKYNSYEMLVPISEFCDDILRRSLQTIYSSEEMYSLFDDGKSTDIDGYFLDLVFGLRKAALVRINWDKSD